MSENEAIPTLVLVWFKLYVLCKEGEGILFYVCYSFNV